MLTSLSSICPYRPLRTALFFSTHNLLNTPISSNTSLHIWSCSSSSSTQVQIAPANVEQNEEQSIGVPKLDVLKQKLELLGIICDSSCVPGHYSNLLCPKCNGGQSLERSLSLYIVQKGDLARWRCFRTDCNWADKVFLEGKAGHNEVKKKEFQPFRQMTEEGLRLVPMGEKVTAYFNERKISEETLRRNAVMQLSNDVQRSKEDVIAFTYRHKGLIVGCKYRTLEKRFWTERGSEKILYGIDDINDAAEIIIVEGEIDKLSMEEAGFCNCVSAPDDCTQESTPMTVGLSTTMGTQSPALRHVVCPLVPSSCTKTGSQPRLVVSPLHLTAILRSQVRAATAPPCTTAASITPPTSNVEENQNISVSTINVRSAKKHRNHHIVPGSQIPIGIHEQLRRPKQRSPIAWSRRIEADPSDRIWD